MQITYQDRVQRSSYLLHPQPEQSYKTAYTASDEIIVTQRCSEPSCPSYISPLNTPAVIWQQTLELMI